MKAHTAILLALLATPAFAGESDAPAGEKDNIFEQVGKEIKSSAKAGWKDAKETYKKAGKDIGRSTVKTTKQVGGEMKRSGKRTGEAAKGRF